MRSTLLAAACAATFLLAGCGEAADPVAEAAVPAASPTTAVTIEDAWVKAAPGDMTAVFGTLENPGAEPLTVVSAKTSASQRTELHEVVMDGGSMKMQPKAGGFTVPAGGSLRLEPGGLHIMILDLEQPVTAGDEVEVRLTLGDGTTHDFTALAKETTAGEEKYEPEGGGMDMGATPSATP